MGNLSTHKASALYVAFEPKEAKRNWDMFWFIYYPKHGSWLNMAEIELNVLIGQCLNRRTAQLLEVEQVAMAWQHHRNTKSAKINWQLTTSDARIKLSRLYPTITY